MKTFFFYFFLPIVYLIPFELLTYWLHKRVMHGIGWVWHQSHHQRQRHGLEHNDWYAILFAGIAIGLFYLATITWHSAWLLSIAIGLTLYGACYFLVHDLLIHRRINNQWLRRVKHPYIKRLIRAHAIHHNKQSKQGCEAFGFLYAPKRYKI